LTTGSSAYDLARFVAAQDHGATYESAITELQAGRKTGHWMWFVFPQIAGLGGSPMSRRYAIGSLDEARAYLAHPVLGPRLIAGATALIERDGEDPVAVLGGIDALKLCSSMTLFARAAPGEPAFERVLDRYFHGAADPHTDRLLSG
jgi:uncharacterized protein (DUF1810 family)